MSIKITHPDGWVLSHQELLRSVYKNTYVGNHCYDFNFDVYFDISQPFTRGKLNCTKSTMKRKKPSILSYEVAAVEKKYNSIMKLAVEKCVFNSELKCTDSSNNGSRDKANTYFESIQTLHMFNGGNNTNRAISTKIKDGNYLFPANCLFYNDDISNIKKHLKSFKYDLILLDPPWYNRFVKRRKKFYPEHGYSFLGCDELEKIPIKELLKKYGLVAVWTTNSKSHIDNIKNVLFPSWGITWTSTWFWIKVTATGEPIIPYSGEGSKQPFERLMFGCEAGRPHKIPEDFKCIISVPSSIHSHKPPINEVLKEYIPEGSNNLELFARYLLPNWTSFGNQVLSLQLQSLYSS